MPLKQTPRPGKLVKITRPSLSKPHSSPSPRSTVKASEPSKPIPREVPAAVEKLPQPKTEEKSHLVVSCDVFQRILSSEEVDLFSLRKICWSGIPEKHRALCWLLLLVSCGFLMLAYSRKGILPPQTARHPKALERKDLDYVLFLERFLSSDLGSFTAEEMKSLKQIEIDLPRTCPEHFVFDHERSKRVSLRIVEDPDFLRLFIMYWLCIRFDIPPQATCKE